MPFVVGSLTRIKHSVYCSLQRFVGYQKLIDQRTFSDLGWPSKQLNDLCFEHSRQLFLNN